MFHRRKIRGLALLLLGLFSPLCVFGQEVTLGDDFHPDKVIPTLKACLSKTQNLPLSLKQALQMAQENNPDYKASYSVVKQARAAYLTQWASLLPDFGMLMPYSKINAEIPGAVIGAGSVPMGQAASTLSINSTIFAPIVYFNYSAFQGGKRVFQILSARKTLQAQKAQMELTLEQTLQQTAEAYYSLQRQLDQIAIAQKQIEESQEQLNINKARLEARVGTTLDVMQSQAQLSQAQQELLTAYQAAESQASRLNELLNLPAIVAILPDQPSQDLHTLVCGRDFKSLLEIAHHNRPEIRRIEAQIASIGQTRNTRLSGYLPTLSLLYANGALGTNINDTKHLDISALVFGLNYKNMGVSNATHFMEDTAQIEEQRHRLQAQLNAIDKALTDAYLQSITTLSQIDVAKTQVAASEKAVSDAMERLKAGVGKNIDVTDAETKLTQARSNLSQAVQDYNLAEVNLVFNLGLASVETLTQGIPNP